MGDGTAPLASAPPLRQSSSTGGTEPRILIIGAGPTGLGAGIRLRELGHENFLIVDRHPYVGGLAASFTDAAGFTWDIGGHVMFSHYEYYDLLFDRFMGEEYSLNDRESWVRMMDRWVPYPFQNNIRYLPKQAAYECLSGLIKAQTGQGRIKSHADAANFGEFIDAVFGEGIARYFMRPYNFKVWAHPPEMMNKTWIGERVAVLDIDRALKNVVLGTDDFGWGPNNRFKYPLRGGTGEFYRRMGESIRDRIALGKRVVAIDVDEKVAHFADGTAERYDILLSAMPLDVLCRDALTGSVPACLRDQASRLKHSSGYMVGIGVRRPCPSTKCWMYFPEDNCPFYRVTYLSNYSPHMTPDADHYSLLCEVSASGHKPVDGAGVVEDTIRGLERAGLLGPGEREDICDTWLYHADYSYPTPSVDRDEILSGVIPWLEVRDIYSRGRFGMWKYEVANTDHTLMQGVELVNRVLLGEPETTIGIVYQTTADGREAALHERPALAGSGEKRLALQAIEVKAGAATAPASE
ncbi:MAG TPA: FAD-dependent oxidoreductase [Phycisphaerales bacterium]|nr:FAD-dependent oxidoreductase [Phycisphaerales bacterium]